MSMSVHCSVLEIHFGIALNNGVLLGKEHMLTPCPALHRHFCAWVGAIRLDSGKDYWGHSCSVDCTVLWLFLSSYQYICLFIIINHLDALISQIYISNETLHVSDSSYVHHQEFFTVHTAMVCHTGLLTACEGNQDGIAVPSWSCSQAVSKHVWHISRLCVQWKTPDDGQKNCPKHVEFHSENKFDKLVHLVGLL